MKRRLFFLLLLNVFLSGTAPAGVASVGSDDAPGWLMQAASLKPPAYDKDVPAVVLKNEQQTVYGSDGKLVVTETYAIRILNKDGRKLARAAAFYLVSTGKVRDMNGWLIRPDGTTKKYEKNTILHMISDPDDVYNEGRIQSINTSDHADSGAVFGYQITSEERPLFFQATWTF